MVLSHFDPPVLLCFLSHPPTAGLKTKSEVYFLQSSLFTWCLSLVYTGRQFNGTSVTHIMTFMGQITHLIINFNK